MFFATAETASAIMTGIGPTKSFESRNRWPVSCNVALVVPGYAANDTAEARKVLLRIESEGEQPCKCRSQNPVFVLVQYA